jgi:hypothetical protein
MLSVWSIDFLDRVYIRLESFMVNEWVTSHSNVEFKTIVLQTSSASIIRVSVRNDQILENCGHSSH